MECINCNKRGHSFRECTEPVTSFGIVALRFPKKEKSSEKTTEDVISHVVDETGVSKPEVLMIMRKHSLGYVEFLRGKYDNLELIKRLIDQMTISEREKIKTMDFEELWDDLWSKQRNKQYTSEYEYAKSQFQIIKRYGFESKLLSELLSECTSSYIDPEWGFPKGRRSIHETEFSAALREFREETGWGYYRKTPYCLRNIPCIIEQYIGSNGIQYRQIYYIGICEEEWDICIDESNKVQTREVGNIGWFDFDSAKEKIRDTNIEKKNVINSLTKRLDEINEAYKLALKSTNTTGYYGKRKYSSYGYR